MFILAGIKFIGKIYLSILSLIDIFCPILFRIIILVNKAGKVSSLTVIKEVGIFILSCFEHISEQLKNSQQLFISGTGICARILIIRSIYHKMHPRIVRLSAHKNLAWFRRQAICIQCRKHGRIRIGFIVCRFIYITVTVNQHTDSFAERSLYLENVSEFVCHHKFIHLIHSELQHPRFIMAVNLQQLA